MRECWSHRPETRLTMLRVRKTLNNLRNQLDTFKYNQVVYFLTYFFFKINNAKIIFKCYKIVITKITYSINIFFAKTVVSHVKLFLTNLVN